MLARRRQSAAPHPPTKPPTIRAQTLYYSALREEDERFNASLLRPSLCGELHFGIRLVVHDGTDIFWGAVVGAGESFTAEELISFPIYILRNHGSAWSQMAYTLPIIAATVILLDLAVAVWYYRGGKERVWVPSAVQDPSSLRSWLLQGALWAFAISALEMLTHLIVAQAQAHAIGFGWWTGLLIVILFAHGVPIVVVLIAWRAHLDADMGCTGSAWWAPTQLGLSISWFFVLGAGLYLGPALLAIDSLVRGLEGFRPDEPVGTAEETTAELSAL